MVGSQQVPLIGRFANDYFLTVKPLDQDTGKTPFNVCFQACGNQHAAC